MVSKSALLKFTACTPAEALLNCALVPTPAAAKLLLAAKAPLAKLASPNCTVPELLAVTVALVVVSYTLSLTAKVLMVTLALLMVALVLSVPPPAKV